MATNAVERATRELEKAQEKIEQARARLSAAKARESEAERKKMTRRKIILGGALVERAERDERFSRVILSLMEGLSRDQDKKAFEGWEPPSSGDTSSPAENPEDKSGPPVGQP